LFFVFFCYFQLAKPRRKKQRDNRKQPNQKDLINELIKKLDSGENAAKKTRIHQTTTKKTTAKTTKKTLNPEKIGSLSHNTKRSKTASHPPSTVTSSNKGVKRTMITRLDEKQQLQRQQRLAKKKKKRSKLENNKNSRFSKTPTARGSKRSRVVGRRKSNRNIYHESPVRRTMDIHFFGLPSSSVNHALLMENRELRREFRPKRTHKKRTSIGGRSSHKQDELTQSAMDIAKQDSMDSLYSFIDKRVHDLSTHASKKHDMNYYKHHIHNG